MGFHKLETTLFCTLVVGYHEENKKPVIPLVLAILHLFYGILTSIFSIQTLKKNALSQRPSPIYFIDTLIKFIFCMGPIIRTESPDLAKWLLCIVSLCLVLTKQAVIMLHVPFYSFKAYKFGLLICSNPLATSCLNAFFTVFSMIDNISVLLISITITPLLGKYLQLVFINSLYNSINNHGKSLTIQYKKLIIFDKLFQDAAHMFKLDKQAPRIVQEQMMLGFLSHHNTTCEKLDCLCRHVFPKEVNNEAIQSNPSFEELTYKYTEYKYNFMKGLYEDALRMNPTHSDWLRVLYAQFIMDNNLEDYPKALSLLHGILKKNKSILLSHSIKELLKRISALIESQDKELDINSFITCHQRSHELKERILEVTKSALSFWDTFQQPDPKYTELYQKSKQINQKADMLDKFWIQFKDAYGYKLVKEYLLYAIYSTVVRHSEKGANTAYRAFQKAVSIAHLQDKEKELITNKTLDDRRNITVIISMEKGKVGKILKVTENVSKTYQWKPTELEGAEVGILMPAYFQNVHSNYLHHYIENGQRRKMSNQFLFGIKKSGYLVPQYIHIAPYPHIEKEFSFVGIMRPFVTNDNYILVAEDNSIIGMTENASKDLQLNLSEVKKIQEICPDYDSLDEVFSFMAQINQMDKEWKHLGPMNFDENDPILKARSLRLPSNRQDFSEIKEFYDQLTMRGCSLEFYSQSKGSTRTQISYLCKIDQLKFSELPFVRVLILKKLSQKRVYANLLTVKDTVRKIGEDMSSFGLYSEDLFSMEEFPATTDFLNLKTEDKKSSTFKPLLTATSKFSKIAFSNKEEIISEDTLMSPSVGDEFEGQEGEEEMSRSRYTTTLLKARQKRANEAIDFLKAKLVTNMNDKCSDDDSERGSQIKESGLDDLSNQSCNDRLNMEHISASVTSKATSNSNLRKAIYRYEESIREKSQFKELKVLLLLILVYFVAAIITVISTNKGTHNIMDESLQVSRTIRLGALRMYNLFELYRRTRCANLVEKGFIPRYRSDSIPDYSWYCINQTVVILDDLATLNSQIGSFFHMLDNSLLPKIYHKYDLKPRRNGEDNITVTNNKGMNEFIVSGLRLISKKQMYVPLDPNDEDFTFILSNIMNDPMIQGEALMLILREHIAILIDRIYLIPIIVFIVCVACSLILIVTILKIERNGSMIKKKLFLSLMKIEEKEYKESINNLNVFYTRIREKQLLDAQNYTQHAKKETNKLAAKKVGYHSVKVFRSGDSKGMNLPALRRIITLLLILSVVMTIQGTIMSYFHSYTKKSEVQNERLFQSNTMLSMSAVLFSEVYEYIGENGTTTVRNLPIVTQIDQDYERMMDSLSFFASLKDLYASDSFMSEILSGDVCTALKEDLAKTQWGSNCPTISQGAALRGLITINSYLLDQLGKLRDFYDASDRSAANITWVLGLQTMRDTENIMGVVLKFPYIAIDGVITREIEDTNQKYFKITDALGIILAVVCVFLLLFTYRLIYVDASEERTWNKRMLQMIPIRVVISNAHIKNYLKTVSQLVINFQL